MAQRQSSIGLARVALVTAVLLALALGIVWLRAQPRIPRGERVTRVLDPEPLEPRGWHNIPALNAFLGRWETLCFNDAGAASSCGVLLVLGRNPEEDPRFPYRLRVLQTTGEALWVCLVGNAGRDPAARVSNCRSGAGSILSTSAVFSVFDKDLSTMRVRLGRNEFEVVRTAYGNTRD